MPAKIATAKPFLNPSLVLASASPRRQFLLSKAGLKFRTVSPGVDETLDRHLTLRELTAWNAVRKGLAVAQKHRRDVVLAADTLVALGGEILGKPRDLAEARQILLRLSGKTHDVCSGVFIAHVAAGRWMLLSETSRVRFHRLTEKRIDRYFAKVDPLDKAGAYAAQGHGAEIIREVKGSFTNVVGLPMEKTLAALRTFGIVPFHARQGPIAERSA